MKGLFFILSIAAVGPAIVSATPHCACHGSDGGFDNDATDLACLKQRFHNEAGSDQPAGFTTPFKGPNDQDKIFCTRTDGKPLQDWENLCRTARAYGKVDCWDN